MSSKVKGALGKLKLPKKRSSKKMNKKEGQSVKEETQEKSEVQLLKGRYESVGETQWRASLMFFNAQTSLEVKLPSEIFLLEDFS